MKGTLQKIPDAAEVASNIYKVILENNRTRVFSIVLGPGEKVPLHYHPDHVVYVLSDQIIQFGNEEGATKEVRLQAGETFFMPAGPHTTENIGITEARNIIVELKC